MRGRSVGMGVAVAAIAVVAWVGCETTDIDLDSLRYCGDVGTTVKAPNLWTQIARENAPAARSFATAIFDEANDRLVLFGGRGDNSNVFGDIWVLSPATDISGAAKWTQLSPTGTAPEARQGHVAAYDAKNNRMILTEGASSDKGFLETWILTNANGLGGDPAWTKLTTTNSPPYRANAWAFYEEKSNALLMYGGFEGQTITDELWVLSNANGMGTEPITWAKVELSSKPSRRAFPAAAFDPAGDRVFVFGGASSEDLQAKNFDDTWTLTSLSTPMPAFSLLSTSSHPSARRESSLVFDPKTKRAILYGGYDGEQLTSATYLLLTEGAPLWADYDAGTAPEQRIRHVAAYSSKTNRMVIFGGETYDSKHLGDTWVLDHANGEGGPVAKITVDAPTQLCAAKEAHLGAECHDPADVITSCVVVWECSDPSVLVSANGRVSSPTPKKVTCTACLVDKSVCSPPAEIEIFAPTGGSGSSSGGSSSGSSGGSSGGASCPGGFLASERSCTPLQGDTCTCNDFPCSACISSADFPLANGHALQKGEQGCIDTEGTNGPVGAVIRPCAPGLCCLVGGQCGGAGSVCGECVNKCDQ